jgi:hypothetical protein
LPCKPWQPAADSSPPSPRTKTPCAAYITRGKAGAACQATPCWTRTRTASPRATQLHPLPSTGPWRATRAWAGLMLRTAGWPRGAPCR